jgi:hypothetical protein
MAAIHDLHVGTLQLLRITLSNRVVPVLNYFKHEARTTYGEMDVQIHVFTDGSTLSPLPLRPLNSSLVLPPIGTMGKYIIIIIIIIIIINHLKQVHVAVMLITLMKVLGSNLSWNTYSDFPQCLQERNMKPRLLPIL